MRPRWRIYYANGDTYDSSDGMWEGAPSDGVIAVVALHKDYGRVVYHGTDHYACIPGGTFMGHDISAVDDLGPFLRRFVPEVKFGVQIPDDQYKRILFRATNDSDFPKPVHPMRRKDDGR